MEKCRDFGDWGGIESMLKIVLKILNMKQQIFKGNVASVAKEYSELLRYVGLSDVMRNFCGRFDPCTLIPNVK
jgi:hypothetical protein